MNKKQTLSIYRSHGDGFTESDLVGLSYELSEIADKKIIVKQDCTPDGIELIFIIGD